MVDVESCLDQTKQTDVLLIVPSSQGLAVNESNVCGSRRKGKGGGGGAGGGGSSSLMPTHKHKHTHSTIHVVSLHSTDYKASAVSVCLRACR